MSKVIGLIGSLRADSLNRHVFNHYAKMAAPLFTLEEAPIGTIPLYNADIQPEPAIITSIANQIKSADGLLIFSPEYNYSIPGVLKNAIDWLSRCENKPFANKPAAIIGASPGQVGTGRMQYHLRQVGVFLDLMIMNKPEVMIGNAHEKVVDGKIIDDATVKFLAMHANQFAAFMQKFK